jgi:conjugative relaxase-like TrwC/TraI family protein
MLSIAKITPAHASSYYAQDNYYSKETGLEQSAWFGKLALEMDLRGQVDSTTFAKLVAGRDPHTSKELVNRASMHSGKMRAGVDLTFSAPKSVSLCALQDNRVTKAHRAAVDATLKVLEQEFAFVRRGKDRQLVKGEGLAIAKFHHDTARQASRSQIPDPQLHTHCVVLNIAKAADGKVLSVFNDAFYDHSKLIGLIYQNELAKELKGLGYQIRTTRHQTVEIDGYSEDALGEFSKRRKQILAQGVSTQKEARVAVLNGRVSKSEEISRSSLKTQWLERCAELGIKHPAPRVSLGTPAQAPVSEVFSSGVRHLAEREVAFSEKKILEFGFAENLGKVSSFEQLRACGKQDESLLPYETNRYGHQSFTTLGALNQEMKMLTILRSSIGTAAPLLSNTEWNRHLASSDKTYTTGQKEALEKTLTQIMHLIFASRQSLARQQFAVI